MSAPHLAPLTDRALDTLRARLAFRVASASPSDLPRLVAALSVVVTECERRARTLTVEAA